MLSTTFDHVRSWTDPDGYHFRLEVFDTYHTHHGENILAYEFYHGDKLIFEGDDFGCSPMHAIDSDATVGAILSFCSLKPGDTDREYFDDYTDEQMAWCRQWGETLSMYVEMLENPVA